MVKKKKKSQKTPGRAYNNFVELVKKFWQPIGGIITAIVLINQYEDIQNINPSRINSYSLWFALSILILILGFLTFGKTTINFNGFLINKVKIFNKNTQVYRLLSGITLLIVVLWILNSVILEKRKHELYIAEQEDKVIILVTSFDDGSKDQFDPFAIQTTIITELKNTFKNNSDVEIVSLGEGETVTIDLGSKYARELGLKYQADIVIWGWYRNIDQPVTIYVENLSPEIIFFEDTKPYKPQAKATDLGKVEFRDKIGTDLSTFSKFIFGMVLLQKYDYSESNIIFKKLLETTDWSTNLVSKKDVHFYLATSYFYLAQDNDALSNFTSAIEIDPEFIEAYNNRGNVLLRKENYKEAINDFNSAIQFNPNNAIMYLNRGLAHKKLGFIDNAIDDYNKAIELDPNLGVAHNSLGTLYFSMGETGYAKALNEFNIAIKINPDSALPYNNRSALYLEIGETNKAITDCKKAIDLYENYRDAYSNCAQGYFALEKYEDALYYINKAVEIDPENPDLYYGRSLIYENLGNQSKAKDDFEKFEALINP